MEVAQGQWRLWQWHGGGYVERVMGDGRVGVGSSRMVMMVAVVMLTVIMRI